MGLSIDREKVIKGLDEIIHYSSDQMFYNDTFVRGIAEEANTLLKEQEAVPVIQREIAHMFFWCCGSCGVAITDGDKFCRMCGKGVKWNG